MTDIRDLLREATADLVVDQPDPVGQVQRAVTRQRRTLAAVSCVIVAVVVAIAVPLLVTNGTRSAAPVAPSPRPATPVHPVVQTWEPDDGEVAAGYGSIWGAQCCGGSSAPSWVDELNPNTGDRIARVQVPGPTTTIAAGAGRVWTIGATDGGPSAISLINPATLRATTLRLSNTHAEPDNMAFAQGSAWVTLEALDQVWRLTPTRAGVHKTVLSVPGGPDEIAATGNGALWVAHGTHGLSRILATRDSARLGRTVHWSGDIYSTAGANSVWASIGAHTALQLAPGLLARCSACAQSDLIVVRGGQIYTEMSTARGLFVSTFGTPTTPGRTVFFSTRALSESREAPTAHVAGGGPLAPDGDGVVIGDGHVGLVHWIPAR